MSTAWETERSGVRVMRQTRPTKAAPRRDNIWNRTTYRSGDGDHTAQVPRAGSMDAYSLPSRGNRT